MSQPTVRIILLCLGLMVTVTCYFSDSLSGDAKELGKVQWLRDFDQASKQAKNSDKPLFVLFDEVPG